MPGDKTFAMVVSASVIVECAAADFAGKVRIVPS
jgi:hypothetical protein